MKFRLFLSVTAKEMFEGKVSINEWNERCDPATPQ